MKKRTKRLIIAAVCVAAVGAVGLTVVQRMSAMQGAMPAMADAPAEETAIPVTVETPQRGSLEVSTDYIGRIQPNEVVNVIPKMAGTVLNTYFEVGDTVHKGDVLFEFDDSDLATIPAQMALAEASYNSARISAEQAMGSRMDLQLLQTDSSYQSAKNSYDAASKALSDYVDDYEPNVDKLEEALNNLRHANAPLEEALKAAKENQSAVEAAYGADLRKAQENLNQAKRALEQYMDKMTVGSSQLSTSDPEYQSYRAQVDVFTERVEWYQKQISAAGEAVASAQAAISQNDSLYEQTKTQYNNAKDGYDTQVSQLRTALKNATLGLQTSAETKDITENAVVGETQETVDATLTQAKAQYDAAIAGYEQQLKNIRVTSPIDGVVELKNVESNAMASQSSPAYVISNKEIMVVKFNVSSSSIQQISVGDEVNIENGGTVYAGQIIEISSMVDSASGLFPVKARVDAPAGALLTGVSVKVTAKTQKTENAVLIPVGSVYHEGGEDYVYVLSDAGTAVRTPIQTGITDDKTIEVLSGLTDTDKVITSWNPNLLDGVKAVDAAAASAASAPETDTPEGSQPEGEDSAEASPADGGEE